MKCVGTHCEFVHLLVLDQPQRLLGVEAAHDHRRSRRCDAAPSEKASGAAW